MEIHEVVPAWISVFYGRTSASMLEFLRQNPEFDVNSVAGTTRLSPVEALFQFCLPPHLVIVLKEFIARGLWLDPDYPRSNPLGLSMNRNSAEAATVLIDAGAPVTRKVLNTCCSAGKWKMLQLLLWQGCPPVSVVEQSHKDMQNYPVINLYTLDLEKCGRLSRDYIAACRRRSATLAATLWVMTSYPPAIWRDLSEHVARRLADIPLEKFCV